jgi:hypothetical protein
MVNPQKVMFLNWKFFKNTSDHTNTNLVYFITPQITPTQTWSILSYLRSHQHKLGEFYHTSDHTNRNLVNLIKCSKHVWF